MLKGGEKRSELKELTTTYLCAVRPSQAWSSISSVRIFGDLGPWLSSSLQLSKSLCGFSPLEVNVAIFTNF